MTKDGKRHKQQKRMLQRADTNALENEAHSLVQIRRSIQKKANHSRLFCTSHATLKQPQVWKQFCLCFKFFPGHQRKLEWHPWRAWGHTGD